MHDLVRLESRGIASVGIATEPFTDEAIEQARLLGMPGVKVLYLPHPVQLLTTTQLHGYADTIFDKVVAALTSSPNLRA